MRPFIKEVSSNVKSPQGEWVCQLGRHTLIVGPNRSHKTTIIQGLELGASGMVDDIMGRDEVKIANTLLSLKPAEADHLFSRVIYSDNKGAEFTLTPGSRATQTWTRPHMVVSRLARKALSGSPAKLHEAMLNWMDLKSVCVEDIVNMISKDLRAKYLDIADRMRKKASSELHIAQQIVDYAGKTQREMSAQVKALDSLQNSLSENLHGEVYSNEDLNELLTHTVSLGTKTITHMTVVLHYAVLKGLQQCPTCSSPVGFDHLKVCFDHMSAQNVAPGALSENDLNRVRIQVGSQVIWGLMMDTKEKADNARREMETYKRLKSECAKAIETLVAQHAEGVCSQANKYLPPAWTLKYDDASKTLGLDKGQNGFHSSLSGAEWATVSAAVACVAADNLEDENEPALLVLEDRAWDKETLAEVMKVLQKFEGQVVIQSTIKPKGRIPSAWTVVESKHFLEQFNVFKTLTLKPAKKLTKLQRSMLEALGFTEEEMLIMTAKTVQDITSKGIASSNVELTDDGDWSVQEGGNLRVLPKQDT